VGRITFKGYCTQLVISGTKKKLWVVLMMSENSENSVSKFKAGKGTEQGTPNFRASFRKNIVKHSTSFKGIKLGCYSFPISIARSTG
jgi:hypothetical protein